MSPPARDHAIRDRRLIWILGGALVLVIVVLVVALMRPADSTGSGSSTDTGSTGAGSTDAGSTGSDANPQAAALPDLSRRIEGDPTALGAVDAPLVLIEFADYRCPFCAIYARETLPVLVEEYVDEGLLRIEWRDVPVFGEESFGAAVAARAAGEQGLFWEYGAAVYAYSGRDHQALPRERLLEIAAEVDVPDLAAFEAALDDPDLIALVARDAGEASSLGIRSTPTFVIGQTPIMGAQPTEAFREAIDAELTRVGE